METDPSRFVSRALCVLTLAMLCGMSIPGAAAIPTTWWVTNKGLDSPSCGARAKPCRSISAAIEKASDGDAIAVGAGLYGDLNGDGAFTAPGEEHFDPDLGCIICISKGIRLVSLHGADDTIIDAGNSRRADPNSDVGRVQVIVLINRGGVTLGGLGAGFTLTGGGRNGVAVQGSAASVKIIGNIARSNIGTGFDVQVIDRNTPPIPEPVEQYTLEDNSAMGNGRDGFSVSHDETHSIPERVLLTGNISSDNAGAGFSLRGVGYQLQMTANVSSNNGTGIDVTGDGYHIRSNSVLGNTRAGMVLNGRVGGSFLTITGNSFLGNRGVGMLILADPIGNVIHRNNFYGNFGAGPPPGTNPPIVGSILNCGILNTGPENGPPEPIDATDNYWGSPNGPGPDPADNAGKACDFNGGKTVVQPFAKQLFDIVP